MLIKMPTQHNLANKRLLISAFLSLFSLSAYAEPTNGSNFDLTQASLEQLLAQEITTASKIARQISDAPSAVSIVTAEDIKTYGYRTLAEILSSMRGLNITNDRSYDFLGGRGYSSPGDYSGRIMLLVDGIQMNDNVYNQSYLGNDGIVDTELIERVEYVSGPGSVTYGNNAFFGIINVITKNGASFDGAQVALSSGSYQTRKARLTYGKRLKNNINLLISASGLNSEGQSFYFPAFNDGDPAHKNGRVRNQDAQHNQRLFAKIQGSNWFVSTGYSHRGKEVPTAPYGADFNSQYFYDDTSKFISGQYHTDLSEHLKLSLQTDYSDYFYQGKAYYSGAEWLENSTGRKWGTEAKFVGNWFKHHQLVFGIAYRDDYERKIKTPEVSSDRGRQSTSIYLQDEIALRNNLWLNLGARYDYFTDDGDSVSPRIALIYEPAPSYTLRLSQSVAHRTPTAFEKYYTDGSTQFTNQNLKMEKVAATELVIERRWSNQSRVLATIYAQSTGNTISSTPYDNTQYFNTNNTHTHGIEFELEHHAQHDVHLRTSYAYQNARDAEGEWAANSPHHLAKFNLSAPLFHRSIRAGLEVQAVSHRVSAPNEKASGYALTNFTVSAQQILPNLDAALTVRNLFDKHYVHIAPDYNTPISTLAQDGRNLWLQLTYGFK
jgi:iron complex outermembrane receptor protein